MKVQHVKKARKSPGQCERCRKVISVGEPYRWWAFRYGGKHVRCNGPECAPRRQDLTQSDFWRSVYDAEDTVGQVCSQDDLEAAVDEIRAIAEEQEGRLQNMPDSLQYGPTGELLQGRTDACNEWADGLEAEAAPDRDDFSSDEEYEAELEDWQSTVQALGYEGE